MSEGMVQLKGAGLGRPKTGKKGQNERTIGTDRKRNVDSECGDWKKGWAEIVLRGKDSGWDGGKKWLESKRMDVRKKGNGGREEKQWRSGRKAMGQWIWVVGKKMREGRQGRGERLRSGGRGEKTCRKLAVGAGNKDLAEWKKKKNEIKICVLFFLCIFAIHQHGQLTQFNVCNYLMQN